MAEESDLEKTEDPSPRRLEQAREEGQVPQSRELSTFLITMSGVASIWILGEWLADRMEGIVRRSFTLTRAEVYDATEMAGMLGRLGTEAVLTLAPLMAILLVASVAGPLMLGGFVVAPKVLRLDLTRLNPLKGLERMFSVHGLAELVKAVLKALLVGGVGSMVMWQSRGELFALLSQPLETGMKSFSQLVLLSALLITASLALLALLDVPFQLWQYHRKLRMSKEEVRKETKETEGDPQIKARIRGMQREMARRRMMTRVPEADVIVTNPTHFSVALKYDASQHGAPVVVAKGRNVVALKIREIGAEHGVPTLEAPPLARALYKHCELEEAVPAALYTAVAEVMAYVFQLNHFHAAGGLPPDAPDDIPVPEGMDPGSPDEA
ncbi:MAG: flagellar type III secretion system protein FlhB [Rhodocyclaceae bacterium]|nr:flagellar type III secretion system protein FlhB [Rhodocyclaceae bacterium]